MGRKRAHTHSADFSKPGWPSRLFKGDRTVNELASQFGVHPDSDPHLEEATAGARRRRFLSEEQRAIAPNKSNDSERVQTELYEQIGRFKMELEWLKKKAARFD